MCAQSRVETNWTINVLLLFSSILEKSKLSPSASQHSQNFYAGVGLIFISWKRNFPGKGSGYGVMSFNRDEMRTGRMHEHLGPHSWNYWVTAACVWYVFKWVVVVCRKAWSAVEEWREEGMLFNKVFDHSCTMATITFWQNSVRSKTQTHQSSTSD